MIKLGRDYSLIMDLAPCNIIELPQLKDESKQSYLRVPDEGAQQRVSRLRGRFNDHCIDLCVEFDSASKVNTKEEGCLKNCAAKVAQYKKYAKDLGFPVK